MRESVTERFILTRREYLLVGAFWLAYALLSIASRLFDGGGNTRNIAGVVTVAVVESLCWAILTPPIFTLAVRVDSVKSRALQALLLTAAGFAIAMALGVFGTQLRHVFAQFTPAATTGGDSLATLRGPRGRQQGGPPIWFGVLNALVLYVGVFSTGLARAYSRRYQSRREEAARNEARLEAQLSEARLDALRRQLDPHFLFNTLNAVSALLERDPRGVRRMIARLSELLRHSFEGANTPEIALRGEIEMLNRYLEIMQVRFQGRLSIETEIPEGVLDALVPSMILQPIVENAIRHGVERSANAGIITISASVDGSSLVLAVKDNGPGLASPERDGVGVRNTIARLAQLYGSGGSFGLSNAEGGGTIARIQLPLHTQ